MFLLQRHLLKHQNFSEVILGSINKKLAGFSSSSSSSPLPEGSYSDKLTEAGSSRGWHLGGLTTLDDGVLAGDQGLGPSSGPLPGSSFGRFGLLSTCHFSFRPLLVHTPRQNMRTLGSTTLPLNPPPLDAVILARFNIAALRPRAQLLASWLLDILEKHFFMLLVAKFLLNQA